MKLDEKYVFHIPLYKYSNGELIPIDIDDILDDLISKLSENGYENLYIVKAKGFYKSRSFDELLITIYLSSSFRQNKPLPNDIIEEWFKKYNNILQQESFGYEYNNEMYIEDLLY